MKYLLLLFVTFFNYTTFCQPFDKFDSLAKIIPDSISKSPESFAKYLSDKFQTEDKIVRALYVWLATNISYDLDKYDSILSLGGYYSTNQDLISGTLKHKKGVCENYAAIFERICNLCGIQSFVVTGYTREFGKLQTKLGHAWNVAEIDHSWYLFDPTWGAGYIRFERFHKKFSFDYYMANPDSFIKTHMPFDPIWQLKEFPITHKDFISDTITSSILINFCDSIVHYNQLPKYLRVKSSFNRAEINGLKQPELEFFYSQQKEYSIKCLDYYYYQQYNTAVEEFNKAIDEYNKYIYNKKRGVKNTNQNEIFESINYKINNSKEILKNIKTGVVRETDIDRLRDEISKFEKQLNSIKISQKQK